MVYDDEFGKMMSVFYKDEGFNVFWYFSVFGDVTILCVIQLVLVG